MNKVLVIIRVEDTVKERYELYLTRMSKNISAIT